MSKRALGLGCTILSKGDHPHKLNGMHIVLNYTVTQSFNNRMIFTVIFSMLWIVLKVGARWL